MRCCNNFTCEWLNKENIVIVEKNTKSMHEYGMRGLEKILNEKNEGISRKNTDDASMTIYL